MKVVQDFVRAVENEAARYKDRLAETGLIFHPVSVDEDIGQVDFGVQDPTVPAPNLANFVATFGEIESDRSSKLLEGLFDDLIDDCLIHRGETDAVQAEEGGGGREGDDAKPSAGVQQKAPDARQGGGPAPGDRGKHEG